MDNCNAILNRLMVQAVIKRLGSEPCDVLILHALIRKEGSWLLHTEAACTYILSNRDQIVAVCEERP